MDATLVRAVAGKVTRGLVASLAIATTGAALAQSGPAANPGERPGGGGAKPSAPTPAAAPAPKVTPMCDLNVELVASTPVLVTIDRTMKGKVSATPPGRKPHDDVVDESESLELVDTFVEAKGGGWKSRRRFAKVFTTSSGAVKDDELNGVECSVVLRPDRQLEVQLSGDRLVAKPTMTRLLAEAGAPELFLTLPKGASVGDVVPVDFGALAPLLLAAGDSTNANEVKLTFARFDAAKKVASLEGRATLTEKGDAAALGLPENTPVDLKIVFDGAIALDVDVEGHRVAKATLAGTTTADGKVAAAALAMKSEVSITATTVIGAPAEKAAAAPPKFRDVVRKIGDSGLTLALPSHWFELPASGGWTACYESSLDTSGSKTAFVQVRTAPRTEADFPAAITAFEAGLRKEVATLGAPTVSTCELGIGKRWFFEKEGTKTAVECYPLGDQSTVVFRVQASTARFPTAFADFEAARRSMRFTVPAKK